MITERNGEDFPGGEVLVEYVPFNAGHDSGLVPNQRQIVVNGREITVHETSNLPLLYETYLHKRQGETPRNVSETIYDRSLAEENKIFPKIVRLMAWRHDKLLERLNDISFDREQEYQARLRIAERSEQKLPNPQKDKDLALHSEEVKAYRDYYYSQAFDAMAEIAIEINPSYDIRLLCR